LSGETGMNVVGISKGTISTSIDVPGGTVF